MKKHLLFQLTLIAYVCLIPKVVYSDSKSVPEYISGFLTGRNHQEALIYNIGQLSYHRGANRWFIGVENFFQPWDETDKGNLTGLDISFAYGKPGVNPEKDFYMNMQLGVKTEFLRSFLQISWGLGTMTFSPESGELGSVTALFPLINMGFNDLYTYIEPRLNIPLIKNKLALNLTDTILWGVILQGGLSELEHRVEFPEDYLPLRGYHARAELVWAIGEYTGLAVGIERHKYVEIEVETGLKGNLADTTTFLVALRALSGLNAQTRLKKQPRT